MTMSKVICITDLFLQKNLKEIFLISKIIIFTLKRKLALIISTNSLFYFLIFISFNIVF